VAEDVVADEAMMMMMIMMIIVNLYSALRKKTPLLRYGKAREKQA